MAVDQSGLKNKLETTTKNDLAKKPITAIDYLMSSSMKDQFAMALPTHLGTEKFVRTAVTEMRMNESLKECTISSLLGAFMQAALLGLEPGGVLGQCYMVPFNNNKKGTKECQFMLGYKGMIDLARRSGNIQSINAYAVYEKDEFEYSYGLNPDIKHKPKLTGDKGAFIGAYAVAKIMGGGVQFEFMSKDEIEKRRKVSKAKDSGPWNKNYEEMAKKTVVRHMFKYLPISVEIIKRGLVDEAVINKVELHPKTDNIEETLDIEYSFETIDIEADTEIPTLNADQKEKEEQNEFDKFAQEAGF